MLRVVDRTSTHTVQKITDVKGLVHYQTIQTAMIGKTLADVHTTLQQAREAVGKIVASPGKETASKSAYPEQQKGYCRD